ncbi:DUF559 domain-containing protein [Mumia zhuanghuii]|uniref:DUF559 domain-containing protein n=1 Tax=Mumia zhuanghuii TaxID=2585211 RepID=UPI00362BA4BF
MRPIPAALRDGPFTITHAESHGVSYRQLRGARFRRLLHGVYAWADLEMTLVRWLRAALLVLPGDAIASHVTALRLWGVEIRSLHPLHFSTNTRLYRRPDGVRLHRRTGRLRPYVREGIAATGAERTFVDCATMLTLVELVQAADGLIHLGRTTMDDLSAYLTACHIHGVVRARRAFAYACERVESPMETVVRLALIFARLPVPETNRTIYDERGRFVARCDLVYWTHKVVVEYDGEWHERSREQRAHDRTRRERLEKLGWTVVVVLVEDLKDKQAIVWRVYGALRDAGYDGARPHFNVMWMRWFA